MLVGRKRPLTARAAVQQFGVDVCLLDDGFQVHNLAKDLEIALLDARRPFDNGFVLPRGLLREPPTHLRRAHAVLLMDPERIDAETLAALRARVQRLAPGALLAEASRVPAGLRPLPGGENLPLEHLAGRRVVALSGIGHPEGFERLLRSLGAVVHPLRLPDHHRYTPAEVRRADELAGRVGATAVVTTAKDAVKLEQVGAAPRETPLWVLTIRLQFRAGETELRQALD